MSGYKVCTKCGERVHANAVVMDHDPETYGHGLRDTIEKMREERGEPKAPDQPYHRVHIYARYGGTVGFALCGPLEDESTQEMYLRWVGCLK